MRLNEPAVVERQPIGDVQTVIRHTAEIDANTPPRNRPERYGIAGALPLDPRDTVAVEQHVRDELPHEHGARIARRRADTEDTGLRRQRLFDELTVACLIALEIEHPDRRGDQEHARIDDAMFERAVWRDAE